MARYFFDFRQNGDVSADRMGCEFETAEKAYLGAFRAALEMWPDLLHKREDPRRCYFEIRDEEGHLLFVLPFWEVLETCQDRSGGQPHIMETFRKSLETMSFVQRSRNELLRELEKSRNAVHESRKLIAAHY